jgi:hypothetical protein
VLNLPFTGKHSHLTLKPDGSRLVVWGNNDGNGSPALLFDAAPLSEK